MTTDFSPASDWMAEAVVAELRRIGATLSTAESLTGGLLGSTIVAVPGASDVFRGAVVTYAADTKVSILGVAEQLIADHGTVHERVAQQMAVGAARLLSSDFALSTTGVAGPGPSEGHQAGTVFLGCQTPSGLTSRLVHVPGDRAWVREETVRQALHLLCEKLGLFD